MTISAGMLNQRISVEAAAWSQDASGQRIATWVPTFSKLPAKVESVTGGEILRGRQVSAEATTMFTIRYRAGVTTAMRVKFEGRTLGIVRVSDPYGDRRELRIECREVCA